MASTRHIMLVLTFAAGVLVPTADALIPPQVPIQQIQEVITDSQDIAATFTTASWSDIVKEQGVRNASFIALVVLLFGITTWTLRSFTKQITTERKLYQDELQKEREFDQRERDKDRDSFERRQDKLIKLFSEKLDRFMKEITDHITSETNRWR